MPGQLFHVPGSFFPVAGYFSRVAGYFFPVAGEFVARPRRRRPRATAALVVVVGLTLAGCSQVGEAVSGATDEAACAVVTPIAQNVGAQVQVVADEIALDPTSAITTLTALQGQVDGAVGATSGDLAAALTTVSDRIGDLIGEAESARDGGAVSQETVDGLETSIVTSLSSLAGDCGAS